MLPIYGLVALTMLKPVHRVFRSSDVFPPRTQVVREKKTTSRYENVFDAMLVYLTKHLS